MEQEQFYFFIWFTLALVNAGLAQSKNRVGSYWFFISLITGPVATFIILLIKKNDTVGNKHG
ncbi:hypothetical protein [Paenibacillus terrigena]|uniref:hypothetical protein n=1 Tax=Paenibacillus terrigena TaxID=369333 RepID=UPI0003603134|nr:hypothetical protein [Paenibacillus terrigena]